MKTISLLHPFSAKAIGLSSKDIIHFHSQPHCHALKEISNASLEVSVDYFTGNLLVKKMLVNGIQKRFWPISSPIFKNRHKWRKQFSSFHFNFVKSQTPDLTIINMSGHGSKYVFNLAKLLSQKQKPYLAMIGGINMTYTGDALEYYKNAHHIIVHTEYQKKKILENTAFSNLDIRVLPLGIDTETFKPIPDKILSKNPQMLYVGRISRLKQIELAITALKHLQMNGFDESSLTIIGPSSDPVYFTELKDLVESLELTSSVRFLGSVQHTDLVQHYQLADVLLLPSVHESFGMVMIESMSCGTPVVALKGAGGPDDIIDSDFDGILSTPENYSNDILELFRNTSLLNIMKMNARKKVLDKYSIHETTRVLSRSVNDALNS